VGAQDRVCDDGVVRGGDPKMTNGWVFKTLPEYFSKSAVQTCPPGIDLGTRPLFRGGRGSRNRKCNDSNCGEKGKNK